jgi:hypothetical protein
MESQYYHPASEQLISALIRFPPPQIDPFLVGLRLENMQKLTKQTRPQERIREQFSWLLNWVDDEQYENLFDTFTTENKMHSFLNPLHDNRIDREHEGKAATDKWKKAYELGMQRRENVAMGRKENYSGSSGSGSSGSGFGSSSSSSSSSAGVNYSSKNPGAHIYANPDRHKLWKLGMQKLKILFNRLALSRLTMDNSNYITICFINFSEYNPKVATPSTRR